MSAKWWFCFLICCLGLSLAPVVKNPPANEADIRVAGLIPGLGRSPAGGHGNPFQYSCLENPMDRRVWQATVHGVTKSRTWLKRHNRCTRFIKAFFPRNECLLIPWLQSQSAVSLEPKKIKSASASTFSLSICHEVIGPHAMILVFLSWVSSQLFYSPLLPSSIL